MNTISRRQSENPPFNPKLADNSDGEGPTLLTTCLGSVKPERPTFLWPGRFPLGYVSLVAGMQGLCKSLFTLDMAARISIGAPWPDLPDKPITRGSVVLMSLEDGLADTIRPRLDAAGADCTHIHHVDGVGVPGEGDIQTFNIKYDTDHLSKKIHDLRNVRVVIIDPLTMHIGGDTDLHRENETRAAMAPLTRLAKEHNVSVIVVMHPRKSESQEVLHRVIGSVALTALPRAVWMFARSRLHVDRIVMANAKMSNTQPAPNLWLETASASNGAGCIQWGGSTKETAEDLFSSTPSDRPEKVGKKVAPTMEWLRGKLAGGRRLAEEIKDEAKKDGIKYATLRRASKRLQVVSEPDTFGKQYYWSLPQEEGMEAFE